MATLDKTSPAPAPPRILPAPSLPVAITVAAIAIGLAALLVLIQSSDATTVNARIQGLQQELADWEARSQELEVAVAASGGLERIEEEAARRFNMVPAKDTIYLTVEGPEPEPRRLPSRFLPQPQPTPAPESKTSSVWDKLFGWIPWP